MLPGGSAPLWLAAVEPVLAGERCRRCVARARFGIGEHACDLLDDRRDKCSQVCCGIRELVAERCEDAADDFACFVEVGCEEDAGSRRGSELRWHMPMRPETGRPRHIE